MLPLDPWKWLGITTSLMIQNTNDGTSATPYFRTDFNTGNAWDLPAWSQGPQEANGPAAKLQAIKDAGYRGVQCSPEDAVLAKAIGLSCTGSGRVNKPEELEPMIESWLKAGYQAVTLHVGWGHEDDAEVDRLVDTTVRMSVRYKLPIYIETHRATITQDTWRTVQFTKRNPEVRFNADFSHWYTGLEMPYGDLAEKLDFLAPVFERVRFVHARCGNSSHIQVPLADPSMQAAMEFFREAWTRSMVGFLRSAKPGDFLSFNPELLPASINYARIIPGPDGTLREESDRWTEAAQLTTVATACFTAAQQRVAAKT